MACPAGPQTHHGSQSLVIAPRAPAQRGASALAHGNRGRKPANATLDNVIAEVIHQARTQLGELLSELQGI